MTQATSRENCQPSFRVRYKRTLNSTTVHLIPIDALSLAMQFSISATHVSNFLSVKKDKKGGPRARNSPLYTTEKTPQRRCSAFQNNVVAGAEWKKRRVKSV